MSKTDDPLKNWLKKINKLHRKYDNKCKLIRIENISSESIIKYVLSLSLNSIIKNVLDWIIVFLMLAFFLFLLITVVFCSMELWTNVCCKNYLDCAIYIFVLWLASVIIKVFWNQIVPSGTIVVNEFAEASGDVTSTSRSVSYLLTEELACLRRLFESVNDQYIGGRNFMTNLPETPPARFKAGLQNDQVIMEGELKLGNVTLPKGIFKVFDFFKKDKGKIIGSVTTLDGNMIITAGLLDGEKESKRRKKSGLQSNQIIWKVSSREQLYKLSNDVAYEKKTIEELVSKLACLIFGSVYSRKYDMRPESLYEFIDGVKAYKSALSQPFRRRQLLHDSEQHFRKAISNDNQCIDAYYNLGIIYLELDLPDEAIKFFELALEKDPDNRSVYISLANSIFSTVRDKYAAVLRKYWKYEKSCLFKYLNDEKVYKEEFLKNELKNDIRKPGAPLQKCYKAKDLCDTVINFYENNVYLSSNKYWCRIVRSVKRMNIDSSLTEAYILRSNLNMCTGDETGFINDCFEAVKKADLIFSEQPENLLCKESFRKALLNYVMALARKVVINNCERSEGRCQSDKYKKLTNDVIDIAEKIAPENSEVQYTRGRANYYLEDFKKSSEGFLKAIKLQPENYDWKANYMAAVINEWRKSNGKDIDKQYLMVVIKKLKSCPTRIKHEALEHSAELDITKCDCKDSNKPCLCEEINRFVLTAKMITIFSHIIDSGEAKCRDLHIEGLNSSDYKYLYKLINEKITESINNIFTVKIDSQSLDNIDKCINKILQDMFNNTGLCAKQYTDLSNSLISEVVDFFKGLLQKVGILARKYRGLNISKPNGISKTPISKESEFIRLLKDWEDWFTGQIYAKIGRDYYRKDENELAVLSFNLAIKYLKKWDDEIRFQRLYSFLGLSLAKVGMSSAANADACIEAAVIIQDRSFDVDTLDPFAHFARGLVHFKRDAIIEAREAFYNSLALSAERDWRAVNLWYEKKIKLHSYDVYIFYAIASIRYSLLHGKKSDRLQALDDSITALLYFLDIRQTEKGDISKITDQKLIGLYWLGRAYSIHGEFEKALEQLTLYSDNKRSDQKTADKQLRKSALTYFHVARCFQRLNKYPQAVNLYSQIIENIDGVLKTVKKDKESLHDNTFQDENELKCHCYLYRSACYAGSLLIKKAEKDIKDAEKCLFKGIESNVNRKADLNEMVTRFNIQKSIARGIIFLHENKIDEAIDILTQTMTHQNDTDLFYHLAVSLFMDYCKMQTRENLKTSKEHIALVLKIIEEQSLEILPCDMVSSESLKKVLNLE